MYINGKWVDGKDSLEVRNPSNGEIVGTVPRVGKEEVDQAIDAAENAFQSWSRLAASERASYMYKVAERMREKKDDLARIATLEMGKSYQDMVGEVQAAIDYVQWYAEEAHRVYGEVIPSKADKVVNILKQPIGVVGAITPWNFPVSMITRKIAPAIAVGCTVVLKPSSSSPLSAKMIFEIFDEVELPAGVVNLVLGNSQEVSDVLLNSPKVKKLGFTGSTEVGKQLIEGSAKTVKKLSLELGGHAPFIVFEDADIELAVEQLVTGKFRCAGQTCVSMNRVYVHETIYQAFVEELKQKVAELKVGDGLDPEVNVGPLVNEGGVKKVEEQVEDAVRKGAEVVAGGKRPDNEALKNGSFYEPTVLTKVNESMIISYEETFGPVAPVFTFKTEEEVVEKANNTPFGLAAYFYTNDLSRGQRVARDLEYGIVGLNDSLPITAGVPFGGIKESGFGKEGGHHGIDEYVIEKLFSTKIQS
ncbi:NAD-dependent succinate-semialdehyde dehydrogenase [Oceanobacillus timonensis]|uniref:NAD-dependent succinate-semialdehyde dehydrogenase n=1 Tax=Oceanobacillus timonensis TaxID=1926285 RepID=UPI0009BBE50B|nr:NAD-dependent succinate-semialdehyde dehydrogenase [Oceanobacillus timonensis]